MKNKTLQKYIIITFMVTLIISFLTPLTGDDWGNYLVGKKGIIDIIASAYQMYFSWEGRFISRIFIFFFTPRKLLWNILNALEVVGLLIASYLIIRPKKKEHYPLLLIPVLLINLDMYTTCFLWLAGNMTYLVPTVIALLVSAYLLNIKDYHLKVIPFILILISSIITPMFIENIGCAYVFSMFLWTIYIFYKEKRISKQFVLFLVLSSISLITMLMSPGSRARMNLTPEFASLNVFEKIFINIPVFITYFFNRQSILIILILIPINIWLYKNIKKHKIVKLCLLNIIPLINIILNIFRLSWVNIGIFNTNRFESIALFMDNWYFVFYIILIGILFLISLFHFVKDKDELIKLYILIITALVSVGVMLLTPVWGDRVILFSLLMLSFISIRIIKDFLPNKKIVNISVYGIVIAFTVAYLSVAAFNYCFDLQRQKQIESYKNNNEERLVLYISGNKLLWNYYPWQSHIDVFKAYYGLNDDDKIIIETPSISELIEFELTGKYRK